MRKKTRDMDRIRFRDIKPYCVVTSLDDLRGPERGVIHLPHWVRWQDDKDVDISDLGGARCRRSFLTVVCCGACGRSCT